MGKSMGKNVAPDRVSRELDCQLTPDEVRLSGRSLGNVLLKISLVNEKVREIKEAGKAEKAVLEAEASRLGRMVRTGKEMREVVCAVDYDWTKGKKTVTRLDTGEVVGVENITPVERQREI